MVEGCKLYKLWRSGKRELFLLLQEHENLGAPVELMILDCRFSGWHLVDNCKKSDTNLGNLLVFSSGTHPVFLQPVRTEII